MKKNLSIVLSALFFCCMPSYSQADNSNERESRMKALADSIGRQYVPDKRVAVYEIEILDNNGIHILKGTTTDSTAKHALIAAANKQNINVADSIALLPHAGLEGRIYGVISLSAGDMRSKTDFEYEMSTQATLGTPMRILERRGSWSRVQTPDQYIGWMHNMSFAAMTKDEYNEWQRAAKIVFTDFFGFAYQRPDTESQTVSDLVYGSMLRLTDDAGRFYKVAYPNGAEAYVEKNKCALFNDWIESSPLTGESIIAKSLLFMGIPYVWGGTSTKGVDCSGLTKAVYFMHGIVLMRDASQQIHAGQTIDISAGYANLQRGDLLFFGKKGVDGKRDRIRHVGFYMGDNKFIHASGYVRISSLDPTHPDYDERNATEFIKATRIANDNVGTEGVWRITDNDFYKKQ